MKLYLDLRHCKGMCYFDTNNKRAGSIFLQLVPILQLKHEILYQIHVKLRQITSCVGHFSLQQTAIE